MINLDSSWIRPWANISLVKKINILFTTLWAFLKSHTNQILLIILRGTSTFKILKKNLIKIF